MDASPDRSRATASIAQSHGLWFFIKLEVEASGKTAPG
jgi:hypothetical protein